MTQDNLTLNDKIVKELMLGNRGLSTFKFATLTEKRHRTPLQSILCSHPYQGKEKYCNSKNGRDALEIDGNDGACCRHFKIWR